MHIYMLLDGLFLCPTKAKYNKKLSLYNPVCYFSLVLWHKHSLWFLLSGNEELWQTLAEEASVEGSPDFLTPPSKFDLLQCF